MAFVSRRSSFGNIGLLHLNLVIPWIEIKLVRNWEPLNFSKRSSIIGKENLFLMVILLRAQKSRHMHQVPSFFSTMVIRNKWGLVLRQMTLVANNFLTIFLISFFLENGWWQGWKVGGMLLDMSGIEWPCAPWEGGRSWGFQKLIGLWIRLTTGQDGCVGKGY